MTNEISRRAYYLEEGPKVLGDIIDLVVKGGDERQDVLNILGDTKKRLVVATGGSAADGTLPDIKIVAAMEKLERSMAQAAPVARQEVLTALSDCERSLFRAAKRAEDPENGFERAEIVQTRGPRLEFTGKLLCEDEYESRGNDPLSIRLEVWQTQGGALIAASFAQPANRDGLEVVEATVVEPQDDVQAMRFAVMDHFHWGMNARSMVGKKLKWTLRQEVV